MSVPLPPAKPPSRLDYGTQRGEVRAIPVDVRYGSGVQVFYALYRWDGHSWNWLPRSRILDDQDT